MKGKSEFSRANALDIKQLLREKARPGNTESMQKAIRDKIRALGFYIEDFAEEDQKKGFLTRDFEELITRRAITILDE